jgi:ribosomal protein S12 methylthiotransferase accessory factor
MITIKKSLKKYTADADKAVSPRETVARAKTAFEYHDRQILSQLKRIDTGRLDIPVYLSICGEKARQTMPTRKQMGKGSTPVQAQASALMELAERFSYFSFVNNSENFQNMVWDQAEKSFKERLIPVDEIIKSVNEDISASRAKQVLSLVKWQFTPATLVGQNKEFYIPFNWFRKLNEFNGCSAGNTSEESILQGACELVERHCCSIVDSSSQNCPTIDSKSITDPILMDLLSRFASNNIKVWLKDFSLNMPVSTVAALAYDPGTFPGLSEIVFTAGSATSPAKAAIRALTEVAQLAGDFHSASNYEASGLPKYSSLNQIRWLTKGPLVNLDSLPDISGPDMGEELKDLCARLFALDFNLFSVSTMHQDLKIPANFNFIPGFRFRERASNACLGLITGRILAEETDPMEALKGLEILSGLYPGACFIPFFQGMAWMRINDHNQALIHFNQALDIPSDDESKALCAFYSAYTLSLKDSWEEAIPFLDMAISLDSLAKEYFNLRGVGFFKQNKFEQAARDFKKALSLDSGSATDLANLGLCYQKNGQNSAAAEMLSKALEIDPTLCYARKSLDEMTL